MRDRDTILAVEKSLLGPLRLSLAKWMNEDHSKNKFVLVKSCLNPASIFLGNIEVIMPLVSLQTGLERVDGALALDLT